MLRIVVHINNQSTWKVETGRSGVQRPSQQHVPGQPAQEKPNLSTERNKKNLVFFLFVRILSVF